MADEKLGILDLKLDIDNKRVVDVEMKVLSFGDGFVEIELVSNLGGYPIAVATDESRKMGIDTWKRDRLVKAGAGAVIPDFECAERLVDFILGR